MPTFYHSFPQKARAKAINPTMPKPLSNICFCKISGRLLCMLNTELDEKVKSGELSKIVFAGGCFWCTEASFNPEYGVVQAISGYIGEGKPNPSYEEVSGGSSGYREAVCVYYKSDIGNLKKLLVNYWHHIDPTDERGQFADKGSQYKTAIFYFTTEQKQVSEESKQILIDSGKFEDKIVVPVLEGNPLKFYPAEDYHQEYALKNPVNYELYKKGSGRADFINMFWKKDTTFNNFLSS